MANETEALWLKWEGNEPQSAHTFLVSAKAGVQTRELLMMNWTKIPDVGGIFNP